MAVTIFAEQALMPTGWMQNVTVTIGHDGFIESVGAGSGAGADHRVGVLLPALSNVHSHSFQRAMAGLAERRGPSPRDDFWTWRKIMYRFLDILTPDDIATIAAQVQLEMMETGFAAQAEFHYLHHGPGGTQYEQIAETSLCHFEAARLSGIGYTHLPVLYMQGGLDGQELRDGQLRFGCSVLAFEKLFTEIAELCRDMPSDTVLGVAPHSLRAVDRDGLQACLDLVANGPVHTHAAEQLAEVDEVVSALGARPVRWILDNLPVDQRWCLIHATHMDEAEVSDFAKSGAVAGLCPITEANLGDGIFEANAFMQAGGAIGVGSDSNVRIDLAEELRMLELSQRLRDKARVVLTDEQTPSNGRYLYERAAAGGAQAIGRKAGRIEAGYLADLAALDLTHHAVIGLNGDAILDAWIFAGSDSLISDVWAAGRHMVRGGKHIHRDEIVSTYSARIDRLRAAL